MAELKDGCVKPARGPILPAIESPIVSEQDTPAKEVKMVEVDKLVGI